VFHADPESPPVPDQCGVRRRRRPRATPQQIIAENTDFRFFNELKRELKA
jgi:hypothetical protein